MKLRIFLCLVVLALNGVANAQLIPKEFMHPGGKDNLIATTDPTGCNDQTEGYKVSSRWINVTGQREWVMISTSTPCNAVWKDTTSSSGIGPLTPQKIPLAQSPNTLADSPISITPSQIHLGDTSTQSILFDTTNLTGHRTVLVPDVNSALVVPKDCDALVAGQVVKSISATGDVGCMTPAGGSPTSVSARVFHNAAQSIANDTFTALAFNSERWDTHTLHDTATNNSRITISAGAGAGKYLIGASVRFDVNTTGKRALFLYLNGTTYLAGHQAMTITDGGGTNLTISTVYDLAVNDYIEVHVLQASGVSLDITVNGNFSPEFFVQKLAS